MLRHLWFRKPGRYKPASLERAIRILAKKHIYFRAMRHFWMRISPSFKGTYNSLRIINRIPHLDAGIMNVRVINNVNPFCQALRFCIRDHIADRFRRTGNVNAFARRKQITCTRCLSVDTCHNYHNERDYYFFHKFLFCYYNIYNTNCKKKPTFLWAVHSMVDVFVF